MKTKNIPEAWKKQWSKFMVTFFDYLPTKYEANKREWAVRKMIWDFKDGKRSVKVAELVAKRMREQFGAEVEKRDVGLHTRQFGSQDGNPLQGVC